VDGKNFLNRKIINHRIVIWARYVQERHLRSKADNCVIDNSQSRRLVWTATKKQKAAAKKGRKDKWKVCLRKHKVNQRNQKNSLVSNHPILRTWLKMIQNSIDLILTTHLQSKKQLIIAHVQIQFNYLQQERTNLPRILRTRLLALEPKLEALSPIWWELAEVLWTLIYIVQIKKFLYLKEILFPP